MMSNPTPTVKCSMGIGSIWDRVDHVPHIRFKRFEMPGGQIQ